MLMAGHALSDSADIWNATGFWLPWVLVALGMELYLSNVEAVAHHRPHSPELMTPISIAKFSVILAGACSIAIFNWYNTFQNLNFSINSNSKIAFLILQSINICFLTFEAWNHEEESHCNHQEVTVPDVEQPQPDTIPDLNALTYCSTATFQPQKQPNTYGHVGCNRAHARQTPLTSTKEGSVIKLFC